MGEIAEMMLDGTLCQGCGDYLGEGCGFPEFCDACAKPQRGHNTCLVAKVRCPKCNKAVKKAGLFNHMKDKHGNT